jgi:hypothetical protein
MSDLELLYVLLAAFYLWECACWIRPGGVALARGWGRNARIAPLLGNQRGGFAIAQPLPPFGSIAVVSQLPVSLSEEGVLAYVATAPSPVVRATQTGRFLRWSEIKSIEAAGKNIRANGGLFAGAQSASHARWLARELRTLAALQDKEREGAIRKFTRSMFDVAAMKERLAECEKRCRPLRWLANALFLFVFVAAPAAVWRFGAGLAWIPLVAVLFVLTGTIGFLFRRAHRSLHPEAVDERFSQTLMVFLYSPAAMRAVDFLSRPLLERFHPLAAASVLCGGAGYRAFAGRTLLDLRHPALPLATEGRPQLAAIEESFRAQVLTSAEALVRQSGVDPSELTRPPAPLDATCRAFCPRCHAQFTSVDAGCGDCGGIPLKGFAT